MTAAAAVPAFGALAPPRRAFVAQVMGLPVSVHVRGPAAQQAAVAELVEAMFAALRRDDALFSTWRADSAVSRIRRAELLLADAPARVRTVAALCGQAERWTDGSFSAWLPDPAGRRGFDPTGLVKGWAVEQAFAGLLRGLTEHGRHDALVCAGGDIAAACDRTDTPDWRVGIEDPRDRCRVLRTICMRDGAVATSGTAARGAHIVDPVTGAPAAGLLSATVVGASLTRADVDATATFVRGAAAVGWLTATGRSALLVQPGGRVVTVGLPVEEQDAQAG